MIVQFMDIATGTADPGCGEGGRRGMTATGPDFLGNLY
jgi:hypothetical protein